MKTRGQSDCIWFVLPIISILMPVVLLAAFVGWFWSGFTLDGPGPEGTVRILSGLWMGGLFFLGLCIQFWYLSIPFFVAIGWGIRNICKSKQKSRTMPSSQRANARG